MLAPVTMVIGHLGDHNLNWTRNQISTFAAHAPNDDWITVSMLLSALALLCLSISLARHHEFRRNPLSHIASVILGVAVSGLIILASYEETARTVKQLKNLSFEAIRQQSFHDIGLLLFFYSSLTAILLLGIIVIVQQKTWSDKVMGAVIASTSPLSYVVMRSSWLKLFGIEGMSTGIKQRVAFLCLWVGALLVLSLITRNRRSQNITSDVDRIS